MEQVNIDPTILKRFWAKVKVAGPDECWLWTAAKTGFGYGYFHFSRKYDGTGKNLHAHRMSWIIEHGYIPTLHVLHQCDNPPCVNPKHLWLGTDQDNVDDMFSKGRFRPHDQAGEANGNIRISDEDAYNLLQEYKRGVKIADLARRYHTSWSNAASIGKGRTRSYLSSKGAA